MLITSLVKPKQNNEQTNKRVLTHTHIHFHLCFFKASNILYKLPTFLTTLLFISLNYQKKISFFILKKTKKILTFHLCFHFLELFHQNFHLGISKLFQKNKKQKKSVLSIWVFIFLEKYFKFSSGYL